MFNLAVAPCHCYETGVQWTCQNDWSCHSWHPNQALRNTDLVTWTRCSLLSLVRFYVFLCYFIVDFIVFCWWPSSFLLQYPQKRLRLSVRAFPNASSSGLDSNTCFSTWLHYDQRQEWSSALKKVCCFAASTLRKLQLAHGFLRLGHSWPHHLLLPPLPGISSKLMENECEFKNTNVVPPDALWGRKVLNPKPFKALLSSTRTEWSKCTKALMWECDIPNKMPRKETPGTCTEPETFRNLSWNAGNLSEPHNFRHLGRNLPQSHPEALDWLVGKNSP